MDIRSAATPIVIGRLQRFISGRSWTLRRNGSSATARESCFFVASVIQFLPRWLATSLFRMARGCILVELVAGANGFPPTADCGIIR